MGVKGLHTLIENNNLLKKVKIADLVRQYRKPGVKPTILVEGINCYRSFYNRCHKQAMYSGGQFQEYLKRVEEFVKAFEAIDVKIVVFFYEATKLDHYDNLWITKKMNEYKSALKISNSIDAGTMLTTNDLQTDPPTDIKYCFSKHCEVILSYNEICWHKMIKYANIHNCIGILSNDTNVLVTPTNAFLLSQNDLDINTMTSKVYDRDGLIEFLKLTDKRQLPLLGALCGTNNNFLKYKSLHNSLKKQGKKDKILYVASYIKDFPYDITLTDNHFLKMSKDIFYNDREAKFIKQEVAFFNGESELEPTEPDLEPTENHTWANTLTYATTLSEQCKISTFFGAIMKYHSLNISHICYEDFTKHDLPFATDFWRPVRANIYGILLQECPVIKPVNEKVFTGPGTLDASVPVEPIYPHENHPGIIELWKKERTDLEDFRWNLFLAAMSVNLTNISQQLKRLPDTLKISTLVLMMMIKKCKLESWEWQSLLITADRCSSGDVIGDTAAEEIPISTRALRISTIYLRGVATMDMLTSACGFPISHEAVMRWNLFDGLLFQKYYNKKYTIGMHDASTDLTDAFNLIKNNFTMLE